LSILHFFLVTPCQDALGKSSTEKNNLTPKSSEMRRQDEKVNSEHEKNSGCGAIYIAQSLFPRKTA
jgi:hypothetical protein